MPRIRTVKPEFWSHPVMGRQRDEVKTMAIALLNWADDEGYFYADPSNIRSFARPFDDESTMTLGCLQQLIKIEYIEIRLHEVRGYVGRVINFLDHQRIDRPKPSVIKRFFVDAIPTIVLGRIDDESTIDRAGKEGNGKEESTKPSARKTRGVNNSQVAKAAGQTRHSRLQQMICNWYLEWAGVECPWEGGEGRNLKRMLDSTPSWPDHQFVTCLVNLAESGCIPKGDRPREWLEKLPKFLHGPLDQYWKSKNQGNGNGNGNSKDQQRNARNREEIIRGITGQDVSRDALPHGPAVPERHNGGSERLLERNPDRARAAVAGSDS